MKKVLSLLLCAAMLTLTACGGQTEPQPESQTGPTTQPEENIARNWEGATTIELTDQSITVTHDDHASQFSVAAPIAEPIVYTAPDGGEELVTIGSDIVYYEQGHDFTYGEGTEADAHSAGEAQSHTVVTIKRPGTYVLSGKLSAGQVAVDLGDDAEEDPNAVVTLILDQVDITCTVAPAVIFYNVYECGSADAETATRDVDTTAAGANVIIADGTENNISGSYVARIYKPGTVELSEDGTEVADAKKLHKYDAAFYSKMSMNVTGESGNSGVLNISAENEGLDSELHLTINGGTINIRSGNDGINTNEDGVSVTTVNGGEVNITVTGETGEGDGIDSNGWLVINGGKVTAAACSNSADAGIDSDMGIHVNGGVVIASGHMLDRIEDGGQNYAVFQFAQTQPGGQTITLKNADGAAMTEYTPENDFSILVISDPALTAGDYTLWSGETQLAHSGVQGGMMGGMMGGQRPDGTEMPEGMEPPEGMELPEGVEPGEMQMPEGAQPPEGMEMPGDMQRPDGMEKPDGMEQPGRMDMGEIQMNEDGTITLPDGTTVDPSQMQPGGMGGMGGRGDRDPGSVESGAAASSQTFTLTGGADYFSGVGAFATLDA